MFTRSKVSDNFLILIKRTNAHALLKFPFFFVFPLISHNFPLREGSVVTSMLIKVDMQAQVDHQSLLNIMQDTLSNGSLGGYQVNSSSVVLKGEFLAHKLVIENVMIIHN